MVLDWNLCKNYTELQSLLDTKEDLIETSLDYVPKKWVKEKIRLAQTLGGGSSLNMFDDCQEDDEPEFPLVLGAVFVLGDISPLHARERYTSRPKRNGKALCDTGPSLASHGGRP